MTFTVAHLNVTALRITLLGDSQCLSFTWWEMLIFCVSD